MEERLEQRRQGESWDGVVVGGGKGNNALGGEGDLEGLRCHDPWGNGGREVKESR